LTRGRFSTRPGFVEAVTRSGERAYWLPRGEVVGAIEPRAFRGFLSPADGCSRRLAATVQLAALVRRASECGSTCELVRPKGLGNSYHRAGVAALGFIMAVGLNTRQRWSRDLSPSDGWRRYSAIDQRRWRRLTEPAQEPPVAIYGAGTAEESSGNPGSACGRGARAGRQGLSLRPGARQRPRSQITWARDHIRSADSTARLPAAR